MANDHKKHPRSVGHFPACRISSRQKLNSSENRRWKKNSDASLQRISPSTGIKSIFRSSTYTFLPVNVSAAFRNNPKKKPAPAPEARAVFTIPLLPCGSGKA